MFHTCLELSLLDMGECAGCFTIVKGNDEKFYLHVNFENGQDNKVEIKACPFCAKIL